MSEIAVGDEVQVNGEGPVWTVGIDLESMFALHRVDEDGRNVAALVCKPAEHEDVSA